jgi:peptidoglycan/LPS O-acetylase OafA/YrhL
MTLPEAYNYVEVGLWPLMGGVLAAYGLRRRGPARRDSLLAAAVLVAFGASDWFEADNGNEWWHPWWLLLWKVASVVALAALAFVAWRRHRRPRDRSPSPLD